MPSTHITLLIPHLLWPEPLDPQALEQPPLPALEKLLARGCFHRAPLVPYETALANCFGRGADAPFGILRLLGEEDTSDAGEGGWLCADPVHLKFHQERIVLAGPELLSLTPDEARQLTASLNGEFADIGHFHAPHPQRWYLRLADDSEKQKTLTGLTLPPLSDVVGRSLENQLPTGEETGPFKHWLNELQMFMYAHPVNTAREARGLPTINSLWFWGTDHGSAARKPDLPPAPPFSSVRATDPLVAGLAHAAGVPAHPASAHLDQVLAMSAPGSRHLVVLDQLLSPALYEDSANWRDQIVRLEQNWFAPLQRGGVRSATLIAPTAYGLLRWEIQAVDRFRFWRKTPALATLARSLAA